MALLSMVRRLFGRLVIRCRRCDYFSISDTQPISLLSLRGMNARVRFAEAVI